MVSEHIVTSFDSDLESIQARVVRMGGLVEDALANAMRALSQRDTALANRVRAGDPAVDELDALTKSSAARLLALRAPTAVDLRIVLAVIQISSHLERCGDYAKNIARRTEVLDHGEPGKDVMPLLSEMSALVRRMLSDALDAFIARDAGLARAVIARDAEADRMYEALFRSLLTHMSDDSRYVTTGMHLHFIAKNIERVGDHATGIAEQTIYLVSGQRPVDDRDKTLKVAGGGA